MTIIIIIMLASQMSEILEEWFFSFMYIYIRVVAQLSLHCLNKSHTLYPYNNLGMLYACINKKAMPCEKIFTNKQL